MKTIIKNKSNPNLKNNNNNLKEQMREEQFFFFFWGEIRCLVTFLFHK